MKSPATRAVNNRLYLQYPTERDDYGGERPSFLNSNSEFAAQAR
jgi:hypothetical protein